MAQVKFGDHSDNENKITDIPDHEVDHAVDHLMKAEEMKKNAPLMAKVHQKLTGKKKAIESLAELRKVASEKLENPAEESMETPKQEKAEAKTEKMQKKAPFKQAKGLKG